MFMLGGDTEVLLTNKAGGFVSAIGKIGGSKEHPRKTEHGFVQEDNVLAEFNINPAKTEEEFLTNTKLILKDLNDIIKPLDLSVQIKATALFPKEELLDPLACVAGCDPDFDAWELMVNDPPNFEESPLRSCGGHLHISFDRANETPLRRPELVRVLDLVAGVPSVLMDDDKQRRELYGAAGCHRPKFVNNGDPYDGVEYRTLSNFWIQSDNHIRWAYRAVSRAVENFDELLPIAQTEKSNILKAINSTDIKVAESLINKYDLEVVNG